MAEPQSSAGCCESGADASLVGDRRGDFELFASSVVVEEASNGMPSLASQRVRFLEGVTLLRVTDAAHLLQNDLLRFANLPEKARNDALHIAVAAVHGIDYLLTWNCTHIANAVTLPRVYDVCRGAGYEPPFVCTPQELMGDDDVEGCDPIVKEVHDTRARLLEKYGGSAGYAEHLRQLEKELDRVVTREPRKPVTTGRKIS